MPGRILRHGVAREGMPMETRGGGYDRTAAIGVMGRECAQWGSGCSHDGDSDEWVAPWSAGIRARLSGKTAMPSGFGMISVSWTQKNRRCPEGMRATLPAGQIGTADHVSGGVPLRKCG
ncbi:MAG TPA: hypothetical protein DCL45_09710 [Chloroflexi bacterium]|nr:hypothetical protein [Chloroflexota bacterium]